MPLDALTAHRPPTRDYYGRDVDSVAVGGVGIKRAADGCAVSTYWTLGFKQFSLHHIGQPLTRSLGYQLHLTGPFLTCYGHVSVSLRAKSGGLLVFQQLTSDYFVVYSQRQFTAQHQVLPHTHP